MSPPLDLIKAIRTGRLSKVVAALDAGAQAELHDGQGDPGLPLGIACFLGHVDIVRELVARGANVNLPDNREATSPLSVAIRGGKIEVVRALIELGAAVPPGTQTGLTEAEVELARWKSHHHAVNTLNTPSGPPSPPHPFEDLPVLEEIELVRCYGTDTAVLDAEMIQAAREMENKKAPR